MSSKSISQDIKNQVEATVHEFNQKIIKDPDRYYTTRYRGRYLYLDRGIYGRPSPICRLTYTGDMVNWEFAIFKYSSERYDPNEWFFPGSEHVNGTVVGAMKAGLAAYP